MLKYKTKDINYNEKEFENIYRNFKSMLSNIQIEKELKRHLFTLKNIEYIMKAYGNNDYPKFLWLRERFENYEYSERMYRTGISRYNYPKNVETTISHYLQIADSGIFYWIYRIKCFIIVKVYIELLLKEDIRRK